MANSRNNKPLRGAPAITHALKEYGVDHTMLGGIRRLADESYNGGFQDGYKEGYQHGVVDTLAKLFGSNRIEK